MTDRKTVRGTDRQCLELLPGSHGDLTVSALLQIALRTWGQSNIAVSLRNLKHKLPFSKEPPRLASTAADSMLIGASALSRKSGIKQNVPEAQEALEGCFFADGPWQAFLIVLQKSIALPDVHSGYGFAIGNVAAFDMSDPEAVVSPGGVGFDINCGVRFLRTNLVSSS